MKTNLLLLSLVVLSGCGSAQPVRVMTLNLACGAGYGTVERRNIQNALIAREDPDIAAFQEVDVYAVRSGLNTNTLDDVTTQVQGERIFAKTLNFEAGLYGTGLFVSSRHRVTSHSVVSLYNEGLEPRVALVTEIDLDTGRHVKVISTHLAAGAPTAAIGDRVRNIQRLTLGLMNGDIVLGDFNSGTKDVGHALGDEFKLATQTEAIDQIWTKDFDTRGLMKPTLGASDHETFGYAELQ